MRRESAKEMGRVLGTLTITLFLALLFVLMIHRMAAPYGGMV